MGSQQVWNVWLGWQGLLRGYMEELYLLQDSARYRLSPTFTVVVQPSLVHGDIPSKYSAAHGRRLPDLAFLAPDCFHFSQRLHALSMYSCSEFTRNTLR